MRTAVRGIRVLGAAVLSGGVIFVSAGPALADHNEDHVDGDMCVESPLAQPDEGVSSGEGGGVSSSEHDGDGGVAGPADWCFGYAGGGAGGGEAIPTGGALADDDTGRAAQLDGCGRGGGGGDSGAMVPEIDSGTADVDTSSAQPGLPSIGWIGMSSSGAAMATAAVGCQIPLGGVGAIGDDVVAPNRIDAGAGALASTSAAGPGAGAIMSASALLAAALEGLRRRRRR